MKTSVQMPRAMTGKPLQMRKISARSTGRVVLSVRNDSVLIANTKVRYYNVETESGL